MNRLEIMKRRILLLVLAAVFVLPAVARTPLQQRLEKLERAVEVTPLESTRFDEKYELVLRQPLDWQAPEKGSFTHRRLARRLRQADDPRHRRLRREIRLSSGLP